MVIFLLPQLYPYFCILSTDNPFLFFKFFLSHPVFSPSIFCICKRVCRLEQDPPRYYRIANGYGIPPGKSLDGDSDSPYPRTDIKDICWLSIKDSRSTLYNRKGQPFKKCNHTSKMSYQKGRRTMAPKKKEKNLKRNNIITLKLTDIELAVLNEAADVTELFPHQYQRLKSFP